MRLPAATLHYTTPSLEREGLKRTDQAYLDGLLHQDTTRFVILSDGRTPFHILEDTPTPLLLPYEAVHRCLDSAYPLYLGQIDTGALFALDVSGIDHHVILPHGASLEQIRHFGPPSHKELSSYMAYGRGLAHWHKTHQFCGTCGHPTHPKEGGHRRECMNPTCGISHFPRTDPAVIMLVHDGDHCLLAHNKRLKAGMYSTLAGFVEPGESFEQAVRREVMEEAGVPISEVLYAGSQPWPFPTAMMIGFYAKAESRDIHLDDDELTHAQWFSRDDLRAIDQLGKSLPNADSISRALIQGWIDHPA